MQEHIGFLRRKSSSTSSCGFAGRKFQSQFNLLLLATVVVRRRSPNRDPRRLNATSSIFHSWSFTTTSVIHFMSRDNPKAQLEQYRRFWISCHKWTSYSHNTAKYFGTTWKAYQHQFLDEDKQSPTNHYVPLLTPARLYLLYAWHEGNFKDQIYLIPYSYFNSSRSTNTSSSLRV